MSDDGDDAVKRKVDPVAWLLGGILAVLLAVFGYVVKLTGDVACVTTQVKYLNEQMHDVADMVGELWRAK